MYFSPLLLHFWLVFVKTCLSQAPQLYWISIFNHRSVVEAYRRITHIGYKVRRQVWEEGDAGDGGSRSLDLLWKRSEEEAELCLPEQKMKPALSAWPLSWRRGKTLNNNWVNEQRTVGEEEELRPNSSTLEKQATTPTIFLRKPKSLCGCWTTQVLGSVRREGRKLGGLIPERNFLCLQGEVLEPTAMMCLNTRKWRFMSVIQQQQNARELFYKRKRKDEDRKILFHRAALFKDKRKEAEVN